MKTIKVTDATNIQLNWLVAKCEGYQPVYTNGSLRPVFRRGEAVEPTWPAYTTSPDSMWPIIEREGVDVRLDRDRVFDLGEKVERWYASKPFDTIPDTEWIEYGPTGLVAAARCYCCAKLGDVVEVPEELT